jgi:hypothetical protein
MNNAYDRSADEYDAGDQKAAERYGNLAHTIERQLTDNCLVVY